MNIRIYHQYYNGGSRDFFYATGSGICSEKPHEVKILHTFDNAPMEPFNGQVTAQDVLDILDRHDGNDGPYDVLPEIRHLICKNYYLPKYQQIAMENGYKPGWVFYKVKDKFGQDIANAVCPK